MMMRYAFLWSLAATLYLSGLSCATASSVVLNFLDDFGGIPEDESDEACQFNTDLLSSVLQHNATNHTLLIPYNRTFNFFHGVYAKGVNNTVIQIDGTLRFQRFDYPEDFSDEGPRACLMIDRSNNVTLTSSHRGLIDGRGPQYWGIPMIGYLEVKENRPRLMTFNLTSDLLIENLVLQDSPYHTMYLEAVNRVEIHNISIVARRTQRNGHGFLDLSALNTDGIDVSGHNVHVHDVDIWTQDDCIAVKDNHHDYLSSNMTFERINASGMGFVIGSIGGSTVKNITFRDSFLYNSIKGIYLKFNNRNQFWRSHNMSGLVEDIRFENITMEKPLQWPIWIGPAQQSDSVNPCHPNPCSLCWPMTPRSRCHVVEKSKYRNIQLVNIRINNPKMSPGVILGNDDNQIEGVLFDHVRVTKGDPVPAAQEDRLLIFPGLRQPIHDPYIPGLAQADWEDDFVSSTHIVPRSASSGLDGDDDEAGADKDGLKSLLLLDVVCLALVVSLLCTLYCSVACLSPRERTSAGELDEPLLQTTSQAAPRWKKMYSCPLFGLFVSTTALCFLAWAVYVVQSTLPKPKWERTSRYYACKGVSHGVATGNTWPIPYCFEDDTPTWWYNWLLDLMETIPGTVPLVAALSLLLSFALCFSCLLHR